MGDDTSIGSSIFIILVSLLSLGGMVLLAITAFHTNNLKAGYIAMIFFMMIISALMLVVLTGKFHVLQFGSFGETSLSFLIGFVVWLIIGGAQTQSVLSNLAISSNTLFASVASELPLFLEFLMECIVIPFAEETFWTLGIPVAIVSLMMIGGKKYKILNNLWLQIAAVIVIGSLSFAVFHVGKNVLSFVFAAIIFRSIMVWAVLGDQKINWWKWGTISVGFAYGAHAGNNWGNWGFMNGIHLLTQNLNIGWIVFAFFGLVVLSAINRIGLWLGDKRILGGG